MDQKQIESSHFKVFRKLVRDFPEGEVWHEDKPDFLIHTEAGRVGVEHRQLFQREHTNEELPGQARESQIDDILAIAQEHAELRGMPPVHASFFFSKQMHTNKKQRIELAREITRVVCENIPQENEPSHFNYSECRRLRFPDEIVAIFLARYDYDDQHRWHFTEAGQSISDCRKMLQRAIDEKAEKLPSYKNDQNLTACWLFIVADGLRPSSFFRIDEPSTTHTYSSPFDRTYFLNLAGPPPNFIKLKAKILQ